MPTRQRLVTYGVSTTAAATIVTAALLQPWRGSELPVPPPEVSTRVTSVPSLPVPPAPIARNAVDVVFAVDTTSSMSGLIEGAKRTVWSIAGHIRDADPSADLRIGLVAYRDIGDEYVTRDFALTGELDAVFTELSGYRAQGGGDTPEHVAAALDSALHKMQWRDDARKLVFLVGDAAPAERPGAPRYDALASEAGAKQIIINTIRCGLDRDTERAWQQIAALGNGQYSSIRQDGGVQQIATPYDDKLAELSARIDHTAVIVGDEGERAAYGRDMAAAAAAPVPAKAARASYYAKGYASGKPARAKKDLVGGMASGEMNLDSVAPAELPEDMRAMDKEGLRREIAKRAEERKAVEGELAKVAKQRDAYLRGQAKDGDAGFDAKVKAALDAQLKK
jgi:Mg-chelatase subunit ChlD